MKFIHRHKRQYGSVFQSSKMSAAHSEQQFQAAVLVIQNLPKNGNYKPSYDLMLRFYGLYKQSICGSCTENQPGFWDVVGRAKWFSWKKMEKLTKEEAMLEYVAELKQVIETMPQQNEGMSAFIGFLSNFYELVDGDDHIDVSTGREGNRNGLYSSGKLMRDSLRLASKMAFPNALTDHVSATNGYIEGQTSPASPMYVCCGVEEDDLFFDSIDYVLPSSCRTHQYSASQGHNASPAAVTSISPDILAAIGQLERDLQGVAERLAVLEQATLRDLVSIKRDRFGVHWSHRATLAFLLAWPFLVHLVLWLLRRRKRIE